MISVLLPPRSTPMRTVPTCASAGRVGAREYLGAAGLAALGDLAPRFHVRQRRAHFVGGDRCDRADRPAGNALDGIGRRRMRGEIAPDRADQRFVRRRYGDGGFVRHDGGRPNPRVDGVIGIRNITACRTHRTNLTS
jgi:hypothetical protein